MPNYNEVFERVEKKYLIDHKEKAFMEAAMTPYMEPDLYGTTCVTSVYYDTSECALIERSLEKPLYKEKLRIRTYGTAAGDALCEKTLQACNRKHADQLPEKEPDSIIVNNPTTFVELKKKFDGIVYKRRVPMPLQTALQFLSVPTSQAIEVVQPATALDAQITREINAMRERYPNLLPHMATRCNRTAWITRPEYDNQLNGLRITFDTHLCFLESQATWQPIIEQDKAIMEIKCAGPYPIWLADALSKQLIYPISFSKYGTAYTVTRTRNQKGAHCA